MDFAEVVRRRRMVRRFEPTPLADDVLERILDHAQRGPSAGFSQGTEFVVLRGEGETAPFWRASGGPGGMDGVAHAPVLILVLSNRETYLDRYAEPDKGWTDRDEGRWPVPYWDIDAGMAAMLILLSAVNEGLGALFFGIHREWEPIRAAFGIPPECRCVGVVALGTAAAEDRPSGSPTTRPRRRAAEVVHRGRW